MRVRPGAKHAQACGTCGGTGLFTQPPESVVYTSAATAEQAAKSLWKRFQKNGQIASAVAIALCISACATPPPAPVSVSRLSVAPALSAARDVSGASDRIADGVARQQGAIVRQGTAIERQRELLERARRIVDGKAIVK